jgi:hypothetical protein
MVGMATRGNAERAQPESLPPWPAEDYVCGSCRVSYQDISVERAVEVIGSVPALVHDAVMAVPVERRWRRPDPFVWSVTEYVCHLRDVFATYTIRLHRTRTEDRPVLEPMLNDLRARRFRYNELDVNAVLDELAATAAGFCDEVAHTRADQWDRMATRLPSEQRTARWLVRQAMHEGQHHLDDVRKTGDTVIATL